MHQPFESCRQVVARRTRLGGALDMEGLPVDEQTTRATLFRTLGATGWDTFSRAYADAAIFENMTL